MPQTASPSLAARIACIRSQPETIQTKRNAVLTAYGQVELLIQCGLQSAGRLAHGIYQASLTSNIKNKNVLAPIAQQELTEAVEALELALPELSEAIAQCSCLDVSLASPPAVAQICCELDQSSARVDSAKKLLKEWKTALAAYARAIEVKTLVVCVVSALLEPLDPPDPT